MKKIKRDISLMIENGTMEIIDVIKKFCKDNDIGFKFRYQRKDIFHERSFEDNTVDRLYYFYIIGNTNDYNKLKEYLESKKNNENIKFYLTDFAEICNVADMDNSFEEKLNECLKDLKKLQGMKLSVDSKFLNFIMPITNVKLLEELKKYSGYMNENHKKMIQTRIDILNNNRQVIDEEFTCCITSLSNDVKELRKRTGMNRKEFCTYFEIPYRTVEDWENKKSVCSNYLFKLMQEKLERNNLI